MAQVISSWITPESLRRPVDVLSESPANGVAYRTAFARESLYIPVVINDPPLVQSVIGQPDVDEIGCTSTHQFQWRKFSSVATVFPLSHYFPF